MKAAIYARISTADQNSELRLREILDYASRRSWEIVETYQDTISGAKASHPGLNRLMADAMVRKFQCLLVWKLDRFGRFLVDCLNNIKTLEDHGIRFVAVTQGLDTDIQKPASRLLLHVPVAAAEFERSLIRERTQAGRLRYQQDYNAGKVGKTVYSRSGKNLPVGRPKRIFNRERVMELRQRGASHSSHCKAARRKGGDRFGTNPVGSSGPTGSFEYTTRAFSGTPTDISGQPGGVHVPPAALPAPAASFGGSPASVTYWVNLDTTPLIGHPAGPFAVAFQLADGSATGNGNNAVVVSSFQFGPGGAPSQTPVVTGSAFGDLSSSVSLTDSGPVNFLLHSFTGTDGQNPSYGRLLMDKNGIMYGLTSGQPYSEGTLYRITRDGRLTVLHTFGRGRDGCFPMGTPAMDESGALYGTTAECGYWNAGTVWKVSKDGAESILHNFGIDGIYPEAGVVLDSNGNVYGNSTEGGAYYGGTLWKVNARTHAFTLLYSFPQASWVLGDVLRGTQGGLYGTTVAGGSHAYGSVWSYK